MHHVSAVTLNCNLLVAMETKNVFGDWHFDNRFEKKRKKEKQEKFQSLAESSNKQM